MTKLDELSKILSERFSSLKHKRIEKAVFDEEYHQYEINGNRVPSVSKLLEPLSHSIYGKIDPAVLKKAATRGTYIHATIDAYLKREIGEADLDFRAETEPRLRSFISFWAKYKSQYVPVALEQKLTGNIEGIKYAGTIDALFYDVKNNHLVSCDWKATATLHTENVSIQLSLYAHMLQTIVQGDPIFKNINWAMAVQLTPKNYNVEMYDVKDQLRFARMLAKCYNFYQLEESKW